MVGDIDEIASELNRVIELFEEKECEYPLMKSELEIFRQALFDYHVDIYAPLVKASSRVQRLMEFTAKKSRVESVRRLAARYKE